jgi:hypothetical protein
MTLAALEGTLKHYLEETEAIKNIPTLNMLLCPKDELKAAGIEPVDQYAHEFIEKAALTWFADYRARVVKGEIVHQERGDAAIRQGAFTSAA